MGERDARRMPGEQQVVLINRKIDELCMEYVRDGNCDDEPVVLRFKKLVNKCSDAVKEYTLRQHAWLEKMEDDYSGADYKWGTGKVAVKPITWLRSRKDCKEVNWNEVKESCDL